MAAVLRIPEKNAGEILLVSKLVQSDVKVETSNDLVLEVTKMTFYTSHLKAQLTCCMQIDGEKIDAPNTIIKALVSKSNKAELLGADKAEQAQVCTTGRHISTFQTDNLCI